MTLDNLNRLNMVRSLSGSRCDFSSLAPCELNQYALKTVLNMLIVSHLAAVYSAHAHPRATSPTLQNPKKDFTKNRLEAGFLQLAPGTLLVLDETAMLPGQLQRNGS